MPDRESKVTWKGGLREGMGVMSLGSGAFEGSFSFRSRIEDNGERATNPEELIGAALCGCFSMMLTSLLEKDGYIAEEINSKTKVHFNAVGSGYRIEKIDLITDASVPGIKREDFMGFAERAHKECPIAQALKVPVVLNVTLR
ncbi:MAG: OsmC family peroxiredoxin [Chitinispirillia bacterium]|nr:OsmC family peroxiredoxin [Chitinispirillia bacterium]